MKLTYETTAQLNPDQLFEIIKEYVEKMTGKMLCNICWSESDAGTSANLVFRDETVELKDVGFDPNTRELL
jgi:hypothetical protein